MTDSQDSLTHAVTNLQKRNQQRFYHTLDDVSIDCRVILWKVSCLLYRCDCYHRSLQFVRFVRLKWN